MSNDNEFQPLSPLADPVVGAIFSDVENAGLAAESLVRSIIGSESLGKVISVTPQRYYKIPDQRGCRVDVEIETSNNRIIIAEVQLSVDPVMPQRNLLAASQLISSRSQPGTTAAEMAETMPHVIAINILSFNCREDNTEFLQPIQMLYTKPPHTVALPQFKIYNVQLPRFMESEPDFSDPLSCWLYAMYTAHEKKLSIGEVVEMTPELRTFEKNDAGFRQYCTQYGRVATNPTVRDEYMRWLNESMRQAGMLLGAREQGEAIGIAKGKAEVARTLLSMGLPLDQISQATGLSAMEVKKLSRQKN
ncbi:hypothetical protein FACS1894208_12890 [Clostridia bacterium]|nr:hypothetical protein FACS1894208_12890 [Clostridia bacterium]